MSLQARGSLKPTPSAPARVRLDRFGFGDRTHEINAAAARLAQQAVKGKDISVAGSVGPLGISADEAETRGIDRAAVFHEQVAGLLDGGADAIFFETFLDYDELELALGAKMKLSKAPTICSLACESKVDCHPASWWRL